MLDISSLARNRGAAVPVSAPVGQILGDAQREAKFTVRVMLIGGVIESNDTGSATADSDRTLKVALDKLDSAQLSADEQARWHAGTFSTTEYLARASAGYVPLDITTVGEGCGAVVISVWDAPGFRPLDHLVYEFAVGDQSGCPASGRLQAGAEFALSISSRADLADAAKADAAFHIFELASDGHDQGSIVWFVDRKAVEAARSSGGRGGVYAWRTESSLKLFVQDRTQLPALISAARADAAKAPVSDHPYAFVADALRKKIFTVRNPALFGNIAREAEAALVRVINESPSQAVVLTRLASSVDTIDYIPLGLLSAGAETPFVGKDFVTVQPLPKERFSGGKVCIDPWTLGMPTHLGKLDTKIQAQLDSFEADTPNLSSRYSVARTIADLGKWLKPLLTPARNDAAGGSSRGEGLVVVAHHSNGRLYFDNQSKGLISEDFQRKFRPGSVAMLSACSIGSEGPLAFKLIDKMNSMNIDTMVVSPFPVDGDFGTLLALNFVREVDAAYAKKSTPTVAELYATAWGQTANWFRVEKSRNLRDMGLEFVMLGDPNIRLCADSN